MNKRFLNSRYYQIVALTVILMLILCVRLFVLTIFQHDEWSEAASMQNTKEITTSAPRGDILDRYGARMKMVERIPEALSGAMANQMYVATFATREEMDEFYAYTIEETN